MDKNKLDKLYILTCIIFHVVMIFTKIKEFYDSKVGFDKKYGENVRRCKEIERELLEMRLKNEKESA